EDANEVRIPHLTLLVQPIRLHNALPRVVVEVTVDAELASADLCERLRESAASVGAYARADLVTLTRTEARFSIGATTDDPDARTQLLLRAHAEIRGARGLDVAVVDRSVVSQDTEAG